ncbi:glutaredoxin family protein [Bacillus wiedmannii]|uniref:glutaredoxin family protein n=1 Tax=Bacillus wiedmannii TaxID=1890302 RepID=UPI000BEFCFC7|nr:glutaredoxin domain-containing protein [Bacillus wiedmannii]PEM30144.1 NrdH-redoxin [Bacillus wiedmannii]
MKKVIVYTKNRCPECEKVKFNLGYLPQEVLESHTIEYRNIETHPTAAIDLTRMGYQSVPVTIVEGHEPIVGFEFGQIQNALGL